MAENNIVRLFGDENAGVSEDRPIKVEPGQYELSLRKIWTGTLWGATPKVMLVFGIVSSGSYYGATVRRCYNVKRCTKHKMATATGWHSDLMREYALLFGMPKKISHIDLKDFDKKVILGNVRTVTKNYRHQLLPDSLQYSVVSNLVKIVAG